MARKPRKEGAGSKKRGKKVASGRRSAPKRPQKRARKKAPKVGKAANTANHKSRLSSPGEASLVRQLNEAQARQAATAEILKIIARSSGDVQPVFDAIAQNASRVIGGHAATVTRVVGDQLHLAAFTIVSGTEIERELLKRRWPQSLSSPFVSATVVRTGRIVAYADVEREADDHARELARARHTRSMLIVPMLRDGRAIGTINVARREPGEFDESTIGLMKTFADQAVIAIENARLFNETKDALDRQTATSDILKVIAGSPDDVQPVFEAIAESARRVIGGHSAIVTRVVDDQLHLAAFTTANDSARELLERAYPQPLSPPFLSVSGEAAATGRVIAVADTEQGSRDRTRELAQARGYRSLLAVPMLRDGITIGTINVTRVEPGAFDNNTIGLLKTFADQAVIAIENTRLFNETREALERQTATADILQVIASSPDDVQPVFEEIASSANRLLGGHGTAVVRVIDGNLHLAAFTPVSPEADAVLISLYPMPTTIMPFFAQLECGEPYQEPDMEAIPFEPGKQAARARGFRSVLFVPLINAGRVIGIISVSRVAPGTFAPEEVQLLQTFASQAVIAIENARLFNETKEALARQTATANILKVISNSIADATPVFDEILRSVEHLFGADNRMILLTGQDGLVRIGAIHGSNAADALALFPVPLKGMAAEIAFSERRLIAYTDVLNDAGVPEGLRAFARRYGRPYSIAVAPMLVEDRTIGVLNITREPVRAFTEEECELIQTLADQAVIAIENARLFNETKEALARQTATADVLKVIASSPSNLQPVFNAIAERSKELIGGHSTTVFRFAGDMVELVGATSVDAESDAVLRAAFPMPLSQMQSVERALRGEVSETVDATTDTEPEASRNVARARGWRSRLVVPLKGDAGAIGLISVTRKEPGTFAEKDVELLRTFADQAVIAIQNVELFEEVQARTRDLQESLQQQTATADVLKVISRSAFDLDTVMDTLARSALDLCGSKTATLFLREGDMLAGRGIAAREMVDHEFMRVNSVPLNDESHMGRAVLTGVIANIGDFENNPHTKLRKFQQMMGFKSFLAVPLMREGRGIGVFALTRDELGEFNQRQVDLVQGFADQAVIAIENTRLFNETTEALERQTATADILKVIAGSPDDVQPVFEAIAARSNQLVGGLSTSVSKIEGDALHLMAFTPVNPEADAALQAFYPQPLSTLPNGDAMRRGEIAHIADAQGEGQALHVRELARKRGWRSALFVPLLRDRTPIGLISVTRVEPGGFAEHHVQLLQTFADQAVIAISNVELFQEVQQRTRELSQSLDDLRAAQDRLVQTEKLASLGQLTAGIAHEIKNPLNFVNNFSALSVELTDELTDVLKKAALAEKIQQEVSELTHLLKSNLEKVVQHGKRADSIVKNMLLHSREGSGEQRAADINALVEESLNLAYHGARAEKSGFNITLEREFDAAAGQVELFPQEITRALLNLISNGFYAATRRKAENGEAAFEPTLLATTKDRGTSVEIRIRDNGTGIPPEVKEKMFNPFFTTKPAGEGTGLGLSMTHDIIVKQHGGTIDVATEPGNFTEFIVVLPRANGAHGKSRGHA
jgi:GAF domain-containing protein